MMPVVQNDRFEIGRVASRTFEVVRHNFLPFLVLGVIATLPNAFFSVATTTGMVNAVSVPVPFLIATFAALFVGVLFAFILQGAITHGTVSFLNQQPVTLGDLLAAGARVFLPLLAIGLLEGIAIGLGFLLLIVPGFILFVMWSVVVPVRVIDTPASSNRSGAARSSPRAIAGRSSARCWCTMSAPASRNSR